ncbi:MAG TPA: insulinase family protein [Opitutus sp.]|nr:insulinase family protein [Opitutus sp.]
MLRTGRAVLLALFLATGLRAAPWPAVDSDLPPDPAVRWGTLPNGLRYAVRPNAEPKGRVSVRLVVAAGSLNERDDERGLAHFVEHMVYRGTRQHPGGELISALQRLGVSFGPDNTAFTFWDHTIYQLDLPDNSAATLREGLGFFREYAGDVTFDPKLIERERNVVLNERDTRDTPDARAGDTNLAFLWPKSLQVRRAPIGLPEQIRSFTRAQFVAFYDAWYRPDRMALVVVGDLDPAVAASLVTEVFQSLQPRGPPRADVLPAIPDEASSSNVRVFTDPGLAGASCNLEHPFPDPRGRDTHTRRVLQLRRGLAFAMLQRRAAKFSRQSDGQLVSPLANISTPFPGWALATFGAAGKINDWQAFVADLEQEHRRAFLHGFGAGELSLARTAFAAYYEDAVRTAATWPSSWIAGLIANSIVAGDVFTTPAAVQRDLAADLAATTPAECLEAFRQAWSTHAPHVFISTNPLFHVTAAEIAAALNKSRNTAVAAPAELKTGEFAYQDFGPPGRIVHEEHAADLDISQAAFANGVRLNFKPTQFEADTVQIYVRVGNGRLSQPEKQPGLDLLANVVVPQGGLGRHTVEELQDVLASHTLALSFGVDSDALDFNARCARRDLRLCLQLIAAHLTDSAYRTDAMPQARAQFGSMYASLSASPGGTISLQALRVISGGDHRFGTPTPKELEQRTIDEVRAWIDPQFKHGPIELGIAGDTTWGEVSAAVAATLGALPERAPRSAIVNSQPLSIPREPDKPVYVSTTEPTLHQVALAWVCPVPDLDGMHMERRCALLADLLEERLRVRLREQLGAAYGCSVDFIATDGFPNLSYFSVYTAVAPGDAEKADRLIRDEIQRLRKNPLTDDEFERVKQPFVTHRDADLRNNAYWGYTVLRDAQQRPERLVAARDRTADCNAIRRSDLEALAQRYFKKAPWFQFVAYPAVRKSLLPFRAGGN